MTQHKPQTITARYEAGQLLPLEHVALREGQTVQLQIVPPQVCITAAMARRKVNRFLLDEVSYLMGAEQTTRVKMDRLVWRVSVGLTSLSKGVVGQVGSINVDAEHGNLLINPETIEELPQNAHNLVANLSS